MSRVCHSGRCDLVLEVYLWKEQTASTFRTRNSIRRINFGQGPRGLYAESGGMEKREAQGIGNKIEAGKRRKETRLVVEERLNEGLGSTSSSTGLALI